MPCETCIETAPPPLCSQRSELEQQLADCRLLCGNKQREVDAKLELMARGEQQLQQKDEVIKQETKRLQDAKLRRMKCSCPPPSTTTTTPSCCYAFAVVTSLAG